MTINSLSVMMGSRVLCVYSGSVDSPVLVTLRAFDVDSEMICASYSLTTVRQ